MSDDVARNRAFWDRDADAYQERHGAFIGGREPGWGCWQVPERELGVLGEARGLDVLELGCGAAQWSIALALRGARPVGLDVSERQLEHARRLQAQAGVEFPLVHASAGEVPLPDASFDVVFCDWGATAFTDPYRTVPEAARLLRPGGRFAFCGGTALSWVCRDDEADAVDERLHHPLFGTHRSETPEGTVVFELPNGEWIRLFRASGLEVERLVELRPPEGARSTYRGERELAWARRWPLEQIWVARRP